ncbi:hypothetical protein [Jeotgalibacillus soli]|uniref:Multidrug ABC transporter ATPase n=1 Tax=Jeotgalibacillus soli TaxID=889306 RepID=A0A0C2VQM7_9BACL|nr:hypothetical protein [Jeotgalibacillus soli]KIL46751.1 hypothetical protein KP78_18690 [Jeotgalibacillus soli]
MTNNKHDISKHDQPANGSMAPDLEEMEQLGRQMEKLRTNEELKDQDRQPGTEQYVEEEK